MWVGDLEGASLAMALTQRWTPTWLGGVAGLTAGAFAGWWLDDKSPNYGRVALIQSAALLGAVAGAISVSAVGAYPGYPALPNTPKGSDPCTYNPASADCTALNDYHSDVKQRLAWGLLAGLNVGLGVGLAMAYLPDQQKYGPSWQRVIMVDLAGLAGVIIAGGVEVCSRRTKDNQSIHCADSDAKLDRRTARFGLVGAGLGLFTGWLLTMDFDRETRRRPELPMISFIPLPGVVPVESTSGTAELLPGLMSQGRF